MTIVMPDCKVNSFPRGEILRWIEAELGVTGLHYSLYQIESNILTLFILPFLLQVSPVVCIVDVNWKTEEENKNGMTKITRNLILVPLWKPIHLEELLMLKASFLKRCKFYSLVLDGGNE